MSVWFHGKVSLSQLEGYSENTMARHLGLKWVEVGDDFLKMSMPVDTRTQQPYGFLHGGASCVLAETIGSIGSALVIDTSKFHCVGIEINANHVKSVSRGIVIATCTPLHLGKSTHVWDIKIHDERERLICVSRLTVAVVPGGK